VIVLLNKQLLLLLPCELVLALEVRLHQKLGSSGFLLLCSEWLSAQNFASKLPLTIGILYVYGGNIQSWQALKTDTKVLMIVVIVTVTFVDNDKMMITHGLYDCEKQQL